jgi:hypothetical protein
VAHRCTPHPFASQFGLVNPEPNVDNGGDMTGSFANSDTKPPPGAGGKLVLSLFFLFFFLMGSVFVWLIAREALAGLQTWTWPQVPCQISRSGVRETDLRGRRTGEYYLDVEYQYSFKGQNFSSDRYRLKPTSYEDYGKVERLTEAYQPGSRAVCFVNPQAPAESVLQRGSLVFPLLIFFPLIFVAIGAIGIYSAWRPAALKPADAGAISERHPGVFGRGFAIGFFALFMLIGLAIFYFISIRPLSGIFSARQWPAVQCRVLSSEVRTHRGNKGNTYSINILYSYVFNDREYKSSRYDFMGMSSSGYAAKRTIVDRYPRGSTALCYVNPQDPTQAVLQRGFTPVLWVGLFPLVFVLCGLLGIVSTVRKARVLSGSPGLPVGDPFVHSAVQVVPTMNGGDPRAPLTLKPRASPVGKCLGILAAALFWNGIVLVFLFQLFKSFRAGPFELFLAVFLIPFVLIGVILLLAVGYFFLAIFNPRPHLTVSPGCPRLGDSLRVEWDIRGRIEVLQDLKVWVEGREEATYRRGTRSSTDCSVFAKIEVAALSPPQEIRSGTASVTIPADVMHSFASQHNRIVWSLQVSGQIPRWPDLKEEFALTILPAAANGAYHD